MDEGRLRMVVANHAKRRAMVLLQLEENGGVADVEVHTKLRQRRQVEAVRLREEVESEEKMEAIRMRKAIL